MLEEELAPRKESLNSSYNDYGRDWSQDSDGQTHTLTQTARLCLLLASVLMMMNLGFLIPGWSQWETNKEALLSAFHCYLCPLIGVLRMSGQAWLVWAAQASTLKTLVTLWPSSSLFLPETKDGRMVVVEVSVL